MNFGRTGSTADTVTSGTSSQKNDDISRIRIFTNNCTSGSSTHNSTNLHSFGNIVRMINFFYIACSQTDLVAIRTVSMGSTSYQFFLRKFTFESFFYRNSRISSTCDTHCLIYISTSGKWITNGTTKTGSCTTKWLNLCRMVVCFILEVDQPFFFLAVYVYRYYDTAGINLIRLFLICKFTFGFQFLHCHKSQIHQADKFIISAFVKDFSVGKIFFVSIYDRFFVISLIELHICKFCGKCSMTAVIRPVSIQYPDLCHGRITLFFVSEVVLDMQKILECHSKIQRIIKSVKISFCHIFKPFKDLYVFRFREYSYQSLWFLQTCFSGIYRVDAVMFDGFKLFICYFSFYYISSCRTNDRAGIPIQKLYALNSRICSLIKLSRKVFYRKNKGIICCLKFFQIKIIYWRLCKHSPACFFKNFVRNIFYIIADQYSYCCYGFDSKITADLML